MSKELYLFSNKFFYELSFKEIAAGRYYNNGKFNSSLSRSPIKWELFEETLEITNWRYDLWRRDLASEYLVLQVVLISMDLMGTLMSEVRWRTCFHGADGL